jgi:hypothetical protein
MFLSNKTAMNLFTQINENIYEMIDAFMNTKPIFQPMHSMDFMDLNNLKVYTLATPKESKV